jgi:hypothetical protein
MKVFARMSLVGSGLGLMLLAAAPSFAIVLPVLNMGSDGSITVTPLSITFNPDDTNATPNTSADVATGTTLTSTSGDLMPGQPIDINDGAPITPGILPLANFLTFPDEPSLSVTLDSFGPGSSNTDCSSLAIGNSCSPSLGGGLVSPIILTATSTGTGALLSYTGTEVDNGKTVGTVAGNFSATITGSTPEDVATTNPFTQTSYSGTLTVTPMSAVPEPRDISLVVLAGLLMGLVLKRRKSEA